MPLAAFLTPQHVPYCPLCNKHHEGADTAACDVTDAARDNSPTVNANLRGVSDDGALGTGFDANGLRVDSHVVNVTDGTTVRASRVKSRVHAFGITDTVVKRRNPDGTETVVAVVPRLKNRGESKRATKRAIAQAKETEAARWALAQRAKLSPEEIKSLNGL